MVEGHTQLAPISAWKGNSLFLSLGIPRDSPFPEEVTLGDLRIAIPYLGHDP